MPLRLGEPILDSSYESGPLVKIQPLTPSPDLEQISVLWDCFEVRLVGKLGILLAHPLEIEGSLVVHGSRKDVVILFTVRAI